MFTWDFSLQCSIRIKFSLYKVRTSFKKVWEVFYGGSKLHFFYTIFFFGYHSKRVSVRDSFLYSPSSILIFGQCTISSVNNIHRMVSVAVKIVAAIIAAVLSIIIIVVIIVVATSGKDTYPGTIFLCTLDPNNNKLLICGVLKYLMKS